MVEHDSTKQDDTLANVSSPVPDLVPLREQHAAVTRRAILQAARRLFAERGFAATPVKLVAERAGVAVQTVYATFGSKAGILTGLVDLLDEQAGVMPLVDELRQTEDPREMLRLNARLRRQIRERCGDIVAMLRAGAGVDERIASVWAEGMRRRHGGLSMVVEKLDSQGALADDLDPKRAADIAAALVTDDICDVLVEQRGWSFDAYEDWLAETLAGMLLR